MPVFVLELSSRSVKMKKIFPILLLSMILGVFSSCIIIPPEESTYTFYLFNNSDYDIRDWYLIDEYDEIYSKNNDGYACPIDSGEISSIKDLKKRDYYLYFEYYDSVGYLNKRITNLFRLESDTTYKMIEKTFYEGKPRSATPAE